MTVLYSNNAASTLASGMNSSATSLTVAAGTGGVFPNPGAGQYFYVTLANDDESTLEIVKVTARSNDVLTIERGFDGTTASSFSSSAKVELRITKIVLDSKEPADSTILKDADIGVSVLAFDTNLQAFVTAFTVPASDGTTGQALITDGSGTIAFGDVDALPSQTGNNGKYLTTDGTVASWDEISAGEFVYTRSNYTATASQTTFTATYDLGYVDVFLNGIKLLVGTEFTATSGTDIVLAVGAASGDIVEILAYETFNNVIAYKNPDGGFANSVYTSVQSVDGGSA